MTADIARLIQTAFPMDQISTNDRAANKQQQKQLDKQTNKHVKTQFLVSAHRALIIGKKLNRNESALKPFSVKSQSDTFEKICPLLVMHRVSKLKIAGFCLRIIWYLIIKQDLKHRYKINIE